MLQNFVWLNIIYLNVNIFANLDIASKMMFARYKNTKIPENANINPIVFKILNINYNIIKKNKPLLLIT